MYAAALTVLLAAGACGECRRDDCGQCYRPVYSFHKSFHSFFCNIAPPCDCRMQGEHWPLEYPGARARGWQSHGIAATRDTPINVGPDGVPVIIDEHGIPRVLGYTNDNLADQTNSPRPTQPVAPGDPDQPASTGSGAQPNPTDSSRTGRPGAYRLSWKILGVSENKLR